MLSYYIIALCLFSGGWTFSVFRSNPLNIPSLESKRLRPDPPGQDVDVALGMNKKLEKKLAAVGDRLDAHADDNDNIQMQIDSAVRLSRMLSNQLKSLSANEDKENTAGPSESPTPVRIRDKGGLLPDKFRDYVRRNKGKIESVPVPPWWYKRNQPPHPFQGFMNPPPRDNRKPPYGGPSWMNFH